MLEIQIYIKFREGKSSKGIGKSEPEIGESPAVMKLVKCIPEKSL
ncbi:hypothetical protein EAL2_c16860 [Peptoclostridium acidaminophilum DSM 3953]|uniref:Uncharacterized protein n=1 Tax=Peptoclostridium acidaminophilum DSM 3953 TaxID=1286171 RepID=W8U7W8_PEPAC|nr:hypothetical protein EAL2_c16860 [Peptoclostridium acidaminophilum DSM 3953]